MTTGDGFGLGFAALTVSPAAGEAGASVHGSLLVALGLGLAYFVAIAAGVVLGVRALLRLPGGRPALVLLAIALAFQCMLAAVAPFWTGDEIVNFSSALTAAFARLDLVSYPHPALYFDLGAGFLGLAAGLLSLLQGIPLEDAAMRVAAAHSTDVLVACRFVSALAWTGVMATAFASAVAVTGRALAGIAALLLLASADLVYTASFSPYPTGVLLGTLAVHHVAFARPERPVDPRWAAVAGALFGLGVGAHYLSAVFVPVAAVALFARSWRRPVASVAAFAGGFALAFVAANPRLFASLSSYLSYWGYRAAEVTAPDPMKVGSSAGDPESGVLFYLRFLAGRVLGWLAAAGVVAVIVRFVRTRDPRLLVVAVLPLGILGLFSAVATRYSQYLMFPAPFLAVAAAVGIVPLLERPASRRLRSLAIAVLLSACAVEALVTGANMAARVLAGPALVSTSPESVFLGVIRDLPPGDRVGITSPTLAIPRLAVTEGRIAEPDVQRFAGIVREVAGRPVAWVDVHAAGAPSPDLARVDWLLSFDWTATDPTRGPLQPAGCALRRSGRVAALSWNLCRLSAASPADPSSQPGGVP